MRECGRQGKMLGGGRRPGEKQRGGDEEADVPDSLRRCEANALAGACKRCEVNALAEACEVQVNALAGACERCR